MVSHKLLTIATLLTAVVAAPVADENTHVAARCDVVNVSSLVQSIVGLLGTAVSDVQKVLTTLIIDEIFHKSASNVGSDLQNVITDVQALFSSFDFSCVSSAEATAAQNALSELTSIAEKVAAANGSASTLTSLASEIIQIVEQLISILFQILSSGIVSPSAGATTVAIPTALPTGLL